MGVPCYEVSLELAIVKYFGPILSLANSSVLVESAVHCLSSSLRSLPSKLHYHNFSGVTRFEAATAGWEGQPLLLFYYAIPSYLPISNTCVPGLKVQSDTKAAKAAQPERLATTRSWLPARCRYTCRCRTIRPESWSEERPGRVRWSSVRPEVDVCWKCDVISGLLALATMIWEKCCFKLKA